MSLAQHRSHSTNRIFMDDGGSGSLCIFISRSDVHLKPSNRILRGLVCDIYSAARSILGKAGLNTRDYSVYHCLVPILSITTLDLDKAGCQITCDAWDLTIVQRHQSFSLGASLRATLYRPMSKHPSKRMCPARSCTTLHQHAERHKNPQTPLISAWNLELAS